MQQVILASQSKQRQELFSTLGVDFDIAPADLDELQIQDPNHEVRAAKVALAKAQKISATNQNAVIVAADTFVVLDEKRMEKPLTKAEGAKMLTALSGQSATVFTGWAYLDPSLPLTVSKTTVSQISFRSLAAEEITRYVESNPVTSWAASFSLISLAGVALVAGVNGSLTSVLGLPIEEIQPLLKQSGLI